MYNILCTEWCRVYCEEDGKCHTVSARSLELEDSEVLTQLDLIKGNTVLLNSKGSKFSCTIVEVFGKLELVCNSYYVYQIHSADHKPSNSDLKPAQSKKQKISDEMEVQDSGETVKSKEKACHVSFSSYSRKLVTHCECMHGSKHSGSIRKLIFP